MAAIVPQEPFGFKFSGSELIAVWKSVGYACSWSLKKGYGGTEKTSLAALQLPVDVFHATEVSEVVVINRHWKPDGARTKSAD